MRAASNSDIFGGASLSSGVSPQKEPMKKSLPIDQVNGLYLDWLDVALPKIAKRKLRGALICVYENDFWQAQVLGYEEIDRRKRDWACNWVYKDKKLYDFQCVKFAAEWETALERIRGLTQQYLIGDRKGAAAIRETGFLALGFADGDIEVLLPSPKKR